MNFGEALQALKEGKKVRRVIWGGYWRLASTVLVGLPYTSNGMIDKDAVPMTDVIVAYLKGGGLAPAQPYQVDLLAEDWQIVE